MYIINDNQGSKRVYGNNGLKWVIFAFVLIIMLIGYSVRVTGSTVTDSNLEQAEQFRKAAPEVIKRTLQGHYYMNSGVMLTTAFENDCVTGFTVMISNDRFGKLSDISKQVLSSELEKVMMDTWDLCSIQNGNSQDNGFIPSFSVVIN